MSISEKALKNHEELWPDYKSRAIHPGKTDLLKNNKNGPAESPIDQTIA